MTLTVRSATVDGATTKGSALTHAEMDANWAHVIQSSNQSFLPSGTGAIATTVEKKLQERKSIFDFLTAAQVSDVISNTGALDLTTPLATAATFATSRLVELEFPAGTYAYATSPNWGIKGISLKAFGKVILKHTGTGNIFIFDAGSGAGLLVNDCHAEGFTLTGNANSTNGLFTRGICRSTFRNISARNVSAAGLRTEFVVCNTYDNFKVSTEGVAFTTQPVNGILVERRASDTTGSYFCTFTNPIAEGCSGVGIKVTYGTGNNFGGGTSEGNGGGIEVGAASIENEFSGMDMEANTGEDIACTGVENVFKNLQCASTGANGALHFYSGAARNTVIAGVYNVIDIDSGANTNNLFGPTYNFLGTGSYTDDGANTVSIAPTNAGTGVQLTSRLPGALMRRQLALARTDITYSASMALDASLYNVFTITVTNGTAFTIQNPTGALDCQQITITIRNGSGGAMGLITWDTSFRLAAWTNPANSTSRSITFEAAGALFREISRTPADVGF